jgi:hypothetical protein
MPDQIASEMGLYDVSRTMRVAQADRNRASLTDIVISVKATIYMLKWKRE